MYPKITLQFHIYCRYIVLVPIHQQAHNIKKIFVPKYIKLMNIFFQLGLLFFYLYMCVCVRI